MKKYIILLAALLLVVSCKKKETTTPPPARISSNHIEIPGTRLSIIPPADFKLSKRLVGFVDPNGKNYLRCRIFSTGFNETKNLLAEDTLKKQGRIPEELKEVTIDGYQAIFARSKIGSDMKIINLLLGDSTFSVLVDAIAPSSDEKLVKDIETAVFSIVYEKDKKPDIYHFAPFTIDITHSVFRHEDRKANTYSYSTSLDGAPVIQTGGSTLNIALYSPEGFGPSDNKTIAKSMIENLKDEGFRDIKLLEESETSIAGQKAHEIIARGAVGNLEDILFYRAAFKTDSVAFEISGISLDTNTARTISEFKYLLGTMRMK